MDALVGTYFWSVALRLSAPVLVTALGETIVHRAGMFNIGIEGMMLLGAFLGVLGTAVSGSALVGVLSALVVGALVGLLYGLLIAYLRADQVVTGIGFNIAAIGLTSLLRRLFLSGDAVDASALAATGVPLLKEIPLLGSTVFDQSPLFYGTLILVPLAYVFLFRSREGLVLRAVGERASAADSSGVSVTKVRVYAMMFGGATAGLGGAYLSLVATSGLFLDHMTAGRGFLAIAIAIFGRWNPYIVAGAAVLFGAAEGLQFSGQAILGTDVASPLLLMIPFVLALVAWGLAGGSGLAPGDWGRPFVRGRRTE